MQAFIKSGERVSGSDQRPEDEIHRFDAPPPRTAPLRYDLRGLSASHLATRAGVTLQLVRHYVRLGLLRASTFQGVQLRRFMPRELHRLLFIQGMRRLGFGISEITQLLILSEQRYVDTQVLVGALDRGAWEVERNLQIAHTQRRLLQQACKRWRSGVRAYVPGSDVRNLIAAFASIDGDRR